MDQVDMSLDDIIKLQKSKKKKTGFTPTPKFKKAIKQKTWKSKESNPNPLYRSNNFNTQQKYQPGTSPLNRKRFNQQQNGNASRPNYRQKQQNFYKQNNNQMGAQQFNKRRAGHNLQQQNRNINRPNYRQKQQIFFKQNQNQMRVQQFNKRRTGLDFQAQQQVRRFNKVGARVQQSIPKFQGKRKWGNTLSGSAPAPEDGDMQISVPNKPTNSVFIQLAGRNNPQPRRQNLQTSRRQNLQTRSNQVARVQAGRLRRQQAQQDQELLNQALMNKVEQLQATVQSLQSVPAEPVLRAVSRPAQNEILRSDIVKGTNLSLSQRFSQVSETFPKKKKVPTATLR